MSFRILYSHGLAMKMPRRPKKMLAVRNSSYLIAALIVIKLGYPWPAVGKELNT